MIVPMFKIKFKYISKLFQSSNFACIRVHLPDSDKKLVVFCQQSFQSVLREGYFSVLLREGYFLVILQVFLAEVSFKKESVKSHYFIKLICYCCP